MSYLLALRQLKIQNCFMQVQYVETEKLNNYTRRHKCQIKQGKQNFLTIVDIVTMCDFVDLLRSAIQGFFRSLRS